MTVGVMRAFGVEVDVSNDFARVEIDAPRAYKACRYVVEPDASAASYFWAAAAITGGEVAVAGLPSASLQGDVAFVDCLEQMGCEVRRDDESITVVGRPLRGVDVDMNAISDTAQTLAVVALFADGPTRIRGVAHVRHKETDRIAALAAELRKLGADVIEHDDGLTIHPAELRSATIETYNDHRMAMSFALAGLRIAGVRINNPHCVEKTYPRFFEDLESLR
jgi:3-phosphoshikimate 1-carboxyvinyltransferase